MELPLTRLLEMHPKLDLHETWNYWYRAAVALRRHHAASSVELEVELDGQSENGVVHWLDPAENVETSKKRSDVLYFSSMENLDRDRVTEDAAEAIALTLVWVAKRWTINRRLQRGEFADWLLTDPEGNKISLEISGVNTEDKGRRRLHRKMEQVRRCKAADAGVACVVELRPPRVRLRRV